MTSSYLRADKAIAVEPYRILSQRMSLKARMDEMIRKELTVSLMHHHTSLSLSP